MYFQIGKLTVSIVSWNICLKILTLFTKASDINSLCIQRDTLQVRSEIYKNLFLWSNISYFCLALVISKEKSQDIFFKRIKNPLFVWAMTWVNPPPYIPIGAATAKISLSFDYGQGEVRIGLVTWSSGCVSVTAFTIKVL